MTVPRAVHSATRLADGRILVAGGCDDGGCNLGTPGGATAELFDPETEGFEPTGDLTISRDDHAAQLLPDGRVVVLGGWAASGVLASHRAGQPSNTAPAALLWQGTPESRLLSPTAPRPSST